MQVDGLEDIRQADTWRCKYIWSTKKQQQQQQKETEPDDRQTRCAVPVLSNAACFIPGQYSVTNIVWAQ